MSLLSLLINLMHYWLIYYFLTDPERLNGSVLTNLNDML